MRWILHYFSLPLLLSTLFSPWKRLVGEDKTTGFDVAKYFETLTFNLISRGIGATVRVILFFAGSVVLLTVFFAGGFGMIIWAIFPPLGLPVYLRFRQSPGQYIERLVRLIHESGKDTAGLIANSEPGRFFLGHTGMGSEDFKKETGISDKDFYNSKLKSFSRLVLHLIKKKAWSEGFLRKNNLTHEDLLLTASWWDTLKERRTKLEESDYFGRPGIGLELLFGYTPGLNQLSADLSAPQTWSHRLIGREQVVSQMERALTSGSSVVLIGTPGVGKKTVVYEFAHRAAQGKLGQKMAYRRVLEFDYNFLLSETSDLNLKKSKLKEILAEATNSGNVILMIRDIQRLTNSDVEGYDFTDVFEEYMEKKELKIIAVSTPRDYERFISQNLRLRKFLKDVEVTPPTKEEAMEILVEAAMNWEANKNITITIQALRKILEESDKYITEVPFPEKALELLDAVVMYKEQKGGEIIGVDDANVILSEKIGVSFAHLTTREKKSLGKLEEIIHKRLVNQDAAVNLIAKSLRGRMTGIKKENSPIGSFLFLGPTGVGKTETAKVLANVYYGSAENIIRLDMAEYAGREGLERLIGSVSTNQPGMLTTSIKNRPASLLLLDEIEKATPEIYNLFLSLLDEGSITDVFGRKINCRNLFVIATSNAGAEYIRQTVTKGVKGEDLQDQVVNFVLEKGIFSPEFLNRFDGVVVYEPLTHEYLVKIAGLLLTDMAKNLERKNIFLNVTDEASEKLAKEGYDPAFGARPMQRVVGLVLGDVLGKAILSDEIVPGDKIEITAGQGKGEFGWKKLDQ